MTVQFWRGRRVLVTGTTGFKGAWLAEVLLHHGAAVVGAGLAPDTEPALFDLLGLDHRIEHRFVDLRDEDGARDLVQDAAPEFVFHLAAQALVRRGYAEPGATYATNVLGAVNILEAARACSTVRTVVHVTTDKVYAGGATAGNRETDPLGGSGPYSTSKVLAELVTEEADRRWARARSVGLATARAGNTLGGGDQAPDRLVSDCVRAVMNDGVVTLRQPGSVRPWLHVLDTLAGYLALAERLHDDPSLSGPWNFGPRTGDEPTVEVVARHILGALGANERLQLGAANAGPPERAVLTLDAARAEEVLGWRPRLGWSEALDWTAAWYRDWLAGGDARALCAEQIAAHDLL